MCTTTLSRDNCWIPTMLTSIFPWKCGNQSLQKGAKQLLGLLFHPGINLLPYLNRTQKRVGQPAARQMFVSKHQKHALVLF